MRYLRTNTATRVTVGPFLSQTDGITPKTALTVTSEKLTLMVDTAGVPTLILDTAPTASGGSNDMVHVTGDDSGFYDLELAAADVNYLGRAMLSLNDVATHCPVFHEFMIVPAVVYDAMILGTDLLDVSMTQILGTAVSTPATAGILDTNVKNMNNVAATSITTVNANQGTTQPLNFTGTGASALVKDDVTDWKASAAPAMTGDAYARLGAPAGASVSADVAAAKADTAAIKTQTDKMAFTVANQIDSNVIDWKGATAPAMTGDAFARLGAPAGASVSADVAAVKSDTATSLSNESAIAGYIDTEVAAIKAKTDQLTFTVTNQIDSNVLDWKSATAPAMTGDAYARLGAPNGASVSADVAAVKADTVSILSKLLKYVQLMVRKDAAIATDNATELTALNADGGSGAGSFANTTDSQEAIRDKETDIETDTAEIGAAGAGLTALATQASVDNLHDFNPATDSVIVGSLLTAALATLFDTDSGETYSGAVVGSVVKEIADHAGSSSLTVADVVDGVLDELLSGHTVPGSVAAGISSASSAGDPLTSPVPGGYAPGTAGYLIGTYIDAAISSRLAAASYTAPDNADIATIKSDVEALNDLAIADVQTALTNQGYTDTRAGYLDVLNGILSAIWSNVTRTLTAGTNIVLAKGTGITGFNDLSAAQVNAEADTALSDVGVTTTVTGRIDATISSRTKPADTQAAVTLVTTTTNLTTNNDKTGYALTSAERISLADALLDRDMSVGADSGGRTVRNALRVLRNKVALALGTMTVYKEDDTTPAFTAAVTTDVTAEPIVSIDP